MAKILSIYVTPEITTICEISKAGKNVNLYNVYKVNTPKGCVDDGTIIDAAPLAEAIKQVLPEKGFKRRKIAFTISSRRIANKEIVLPYIKNKRKITEIITSNARDYFPMSNINDYVYEYTILEVFEDNGRKQYRLSAVAVQKEQLNSYHELAAKIGLDIETIDYYGNSVFQIMKQQMEEGNTLVLQIEKEMTHVSIMAGKAQVFRRTVPFGENVIVQGIAELKSVSEEEAYHVLHTGENIRARLTGEEYKEVVRDIVSSVIRVVDFHVSRNPEMAINTVKIFGEGESLAAISDAMERELNIPVSSPKTLAGVNIKIKEEFDEENAMIYLPNLGAILASLDLRIEAEEKKSTNSSRILLIALIGSGVISLSIVAVTFMNYFDLIGRKVQLQSDIKEIEHIEQLFLEYERTNSELATIKTYYDSTRSPNESLYQFIMDLEQIMPESVGITQFDSKEGEVTMTGIARGKEPIAAFVMELKKISYISDVFVRDMTDTYDEVGVPTSIFNMTFKFQDIIKGEENSETDGER